MEAHLSVAKLDEQLCFALYSASSHLTSLYRPLLEPLDLTYTQFIVLMALWQKDEISISQLAERTSLSKATMTPLLKRLEKKGLIHRKVLVDNERQKSIVLTDAGRDISLQSTEITNKVSCATGLTEQEAKSMIALCQKLKFPT